MKEHHFLKAVPCNAVVLCKDQEVFHSCLMGGYEVFLKLEAVFFTGCGLIDRFESVFLKNFTCFDGIADNAVNLNFGYRHTIHSEYSGERRADIDGLLDAMGPPAGGNPTDQLIAILLVANRSAQARPMPLRPPVIRMTLPEKRLI